MGRKPKVSYRKLSRKKDTRASRKYPSAAEQPCEKLLPSDPGEQQALEKILALLLKSSKVDFSHYRQTTIIRRLTRRMNLSRKKSYTEYLEFLENNPDRLQRLYDDLLLSFTQFFRDKYVYEKLRQQVYPRLIEGRSVKSPIRIWVPGCSTGQEVYSLAISLYEYLEESGSKALFQFFGTDLSEKHIKTARSAVYSEKINTRVSAGRLERFFDRHKDGYKVTKHIREMCVFACQNVTQDPPFPNIDMVSCRNVLIYFNALFQEITIPMFHFSLRPNGFLLLGTSETMSKFGELFVPVDQEINLYMKRNSGVKPSYHFPTPSGIAARKSDGKNAALKNSGSCVNDITKQIEQTLLSSYVPPGVLVDGNMGILQFYGDTSDYLFPASGRASLKLPKMAVEGIMPDIYVGLEEVKKNKNRVRKKNITYTRNGNNFATDICILPVEESDGQVNLFLILFEKNSSLPGFVDKPGENNKGKQSELERLRQELNTTKQHLQAIIQDKEEVNQSLWAANQEVQSTNEELQSVNEEMEAAKEELESGNEELVSLNEELRMKNLELLKTQQDLAESEETFRSIIESSPMGVYVYELREDDRLVLIASNESADKMLKIENDKYIGLTIEEAFPGLVGTEIPERYRRAARYGEGWSSEYMDYNYGEIKGAFEIYAFRIAPGKMAVMFNDVTERKKIQEDLRIEKEFTDAALNSQRDTFYLFDPVTRKPIRWNRALCDISGYTDREISMMVMPDDFYSRDDQKRASVFIAEVMKNGSGSIELDLICKDGHKVPTEYDVSVIYDEEKQTDYLISVGRDISERRRDKAALQKRILALTEPLDDACNIEFEELFNLDDIQQFQDEFAEATGVASIITTPEGVPITRPSRFCRLCEGIIRKTEKGLANCYKSDATIGRFNPDGPIIQKCLSSGLWDAGASISVGGRHIANWLIGQVRDEDFTEKMVRQYALDIGADPDEAASAFYDVPVMPKEKFALIAQMLYTLADQISKIAYQNIQQARFITQRKEAEQALVQSEQRFRAMFEQAAVGVAQIELETGKFLRVNQKYCDITGYTRDEMESLDFQSITYPDDLREDLNKMKQLREGGIREFAIEKRYYRKDGNVVWVNLTVSSMWESGRKPDHYIAVVEDITDRKKAEEQLKASKEFAESLLEAANTIVVALDSKANIAIFNRHAEELTGYRKEEVQGKNWFDIFIPERDRHLIPTVFKDALSNMLEISEYENPIVTKQGNERLISWRNTVLKDSLGNAEGILSIGIDITDRKAAENALRESELRLREAQEMSKLGNWYWDINTGQVDWSEEVYKIFRLDPEEFTPQIDSILELSPWPEDHQRDKEIVQKAIKSRQPGSYEQKFLRPDGSVGYYYSTFQGIYDCNDNLVAMKGTVQDITERKTAEIERESLLKTLTSKNRELQSIVYVASHDLKSPLVNIAGFGTELVRDCKELAGLLNNLKLEGEVSDNINSIINEYIPKSIQFITSGTDKMKMLLDGLLQVSRVGTASLNISRIDMDQMIRQVVEVNQYRANECGAEIKVDKLPECVGDAAMVNQVFSNLLGNALKYLDESRQGNIHIYGWYDDGKSVYCVQDNGIGIHANHIGKIFEVFHRLNPNDSAGGEGLGLSIISRALDRLNGSIWVESEPGIGSKFIVSLPRE